jgi:hypothetical protein
LEKVGDLRTAPLHRPGLLRTVELVLQPLLLGVDVSTLEEEGLPVALAVPTQFVKRTKRIFDSSSGVWAPS